MAHQNALRTSIEERQRSTFTSFPCDFKNNLLYPSRTDDKEESWWNDCKKDELVRWSVSKRDEKKTTLNANIGWQLPNVRTGDEEDSNDDEQSLDSFENEAFFENDRSPKDDSKTESLHVLKLDRTRGLVDVDVLTETTATGNTSYNNSGEGFMARKN